MTVTVMPGGLEGQVSAPPSKSAAHRAMICAALSMGPGKVFPVSESADMTATLAVLKAMGFPAVRQGEAILFGSPVSAAGPVCPCGESGSTLRFLLPVAAALGLEAVFTGDGRLPERPLEPLLSLMKQHDVRFSADTLPFTISGQLSPGLYQLPGDVSSQFISGLLFALPLLEAESRIQITSPLQSAGYVDLTLQALEASGIQVTRETDGFIISGGQRYLPLSRRVEADWSGGAFWLCAGALFGAVTVEGLDTASAQGDKAVLDILRDMGASISTEQGLITVSKSSLRGVRVDAAPIPDLVPVLAVTAAFARGDTEIYNAARLRIKESDRLSAVTKLLRALGGTVEEYPDRLVIHGGPLHGGHVDGANDHRIVMSAAIAALGCDGPVRVSHGEAVAKSYPDFFEVLKQLGGVCHVL